MTDNLENWFLDVLGKSASFEVFPGHVPETPIKADDEQGEEDLGEEEDAHSRRSTRTRRRKIRKKRQKKRKEREKREKKEKKKEEKEAEEEDEEE